MKELLKKDHIDIIKCILFRTLYLTTLMNHYVIINQMAFEDDSVWFVRGDAEVEKIINLIFVLREEIVSAAVLLFLLSYCVRTQRTSRDNSFIRICMFAFLHVLLDAVSFLMANSTKFPSTVSDIFQKALYISAVMCINELFTYVHGIAYFKKKRKNVRVSSYAIVSACLIAVLVFKVQYSEFNGMVYASGIPLIIAFSVAIFYELSTIILLIVRFREAGEDFCKIMLPAVR